MMNKIHGRLSFLILLFTILFIADLLINKTLDEKNAYSLFLIRDKEKNELFDKLFKLQGRSLELYAYDYTYWDEMVNFVAKPDEKWAAINIDAVLSSYNAQYVCVYDLNLNPVYTVNTIESSNKKREILPHYILKEIFDKKWFNHFFIQTDNGILEIRTAPIQPGADIKRETAPKGYFAAGRLWSKDYINELSELIESKIEIIPADINNKPGKYKSNDTIIIERFLLGWDNNPLITLRAVSENDIVKTRAMESSDIEFIFSLIFVTVLILILFYFIYLWVSKPLRKLTLALETEDTKKIGAIIKSKTEFGVLANLIETFLSQKKELVNEINEHKITKELLEHIATTSPALITVYDVDVQTNIYQNRSILSDLGYTEEDIIKIKSHSNASSLNMIHEDDNKVIEDFYNNLYSLKDNENREMEYRIKDKFGTWQWIRRVYSVFHRDEKGYPSQIVSVFENITNKKLAEDQVLGSLKEKEILLKEVHHRVKNNLQVISSLLKLQSEYIKDKNDLEIFRESQNRVKTMALIHEKLYRSRDIARIDFGDYVQNLASSLLLTYDVNLHKIKLKFNFDKIFFDIDTAIPCGLLINELISNCIKHAFGKDDTGEITILIKSEDEDKYTLTVKDNGKGFPENIDFRNTKSLGMQLVVTLADQLDAVINMDNHTGTAFTIAFKELKYRER